MNAALVLIAKEGLKQLANAVSTAVLDAQMVAFLPFPPWLKVAARVARFAQLSNFAKLLTTIQAVITRDGPDEGLASGILLNGGYLAVYLITAFTWTHLGIVWAIFWKSLLFGVLLLSAVCVTPRETTFRVLTILRSIVIGSCVWTYRSCIYCARTYAIIYRHMSHLLQKPYTIYQTYISFGAPLSRDNPLLYEYRALETHRDIRLLQVHRKWPFGKCFCTMVHTSLDTAPNFEAISYTWGNLPRSRKMLLDGQVIFVAETVLEIIQGRASFLDKKLLWIDSVCINQDDPDEKSRQVAVMRDIFQTAHRVVAWLRYQSFYRAVMCVCFMNYLKLQFLRNLPDEERRRVLRLGSQDIGWQILFEFFDNPYWRRAWIVQELVLNKNVIVVYGGHYVRLDLIQDLVDQLRSTDNKFDSPLTSLFDNQVTAGTMTPLGLDQMRNIFDARTSYQASGSAEQLMTLWPQNRKCLSTDPRDKLYALLGLVSAVDKDALKPDYSKPIPEVFTHAARHCCLEGNGALRLLSFAGIGYGHFSKALPSWVPDFSAASDRVPFEVGPRTRPFAYNATGDSVGSCPLHSSLDVLTTSAIPFDTIDQISDAMLSRYDFAPDVVSVTNSVLDRLTAIYDFADTRLGSGSYVNGQSKSEAIWRTLMGDRDFMTQQRPLPSRYGAYLALLLRFWRRCESFEDFIQSTDAIRAFANHKILSVEDAKTFLKQSDRVQVKDGFDEMNTQVGRTTIFLFERRLAVTSRGALGIVPDSAQPGDTVCVFAGSSSCWVVRPGMAEDIPDIGIRDFCADGSKYPCRLVGESYMHGFMDGEVLKEGREWRTFAIW